MVISSSHLFGNMMASLIRLLYYMVEQLSHLLDNIMVSLIH